MTDHAPVEHLAAEYARHGYDYDLATACARAERRLYSLYLESGAMPSQMRREVTKVIKLYVAPRDLVKVRDHVVARATGQEAA